MDFHPLFITGHWWAVVEGEWREVNPPGDAPREVRMGTWVE